MTGNSEAPGPTPEDMGLEKDTSAEGDARQETGRDAYLAKARPAEIIDKIEQAPDFKKHLLPGETVIGVEKPDILESTHYPSVLKSIQKLTASEHFDEIGEHGPSVASRTGPESNEVEALRKYEVVFGRDSLQVAFDSADRYPKLLKTTILEMAKLQGTVSNPKSKEEAGRIVHEARDPEDPIAKSLTERHGWEWPYYGSIDATPMFMSAVAKTVGIEGLSFLNQTYEGRDENTHTILDALNNSLRWLETRLESNPESLLEFRQSTIISDRPEVWKDSPDAYFHADGTLANWQGGIASIEVQALVYDALIDTAVTYENLATNGNTQNPEGLLNKAQEIRERAENIKNVVMNNFWVEDEKGSYFALGTDRDENGELRSLRIRTSNMGHLLNSRILDGDDPETVRRVEEVIKTLFLPDMLNASGIRTLSNQEKRFREGAYHNGSVWLWDTYYIAEGLERHGYYGLSLDLKSRIWKVVDKTRKFPEYVRGGEAEPVLNELIIDLWDEKNQFINRVEQPPQEIQAWTVSAILSAMHKNDPLRRPTKRVPTQATGLDKRALEQEILGNLKAE